MQVRIAPGVLLLAASGLAKPAMAQNVLDEVSQSTGLPTWAIGLIIAAVILVVIGIIVLTCWCRRRNKKKRNLWIEGEQEKAANQAAARAEQHEERKGGRGELYEQIRSKYGLDESTQSMGQSRV